MAERHGPLPEVAPDKRVWPELTKEQLEVAMTEQAAFVGRSRAAAAEPLKTISPEENGRPGFDGPSFCRNPGRAPVFICEIDPDSIVVECHPVAERVPLTGEHRFGLDHI